MPEKFVIGANKIDILSAISRKQLEKKVEFEERVWSAVLPKNRVQLHNQILPFKKHSDAIVQIRQISSEEAQIELAILPDSNSPEGQQILDLIAKDRWDLAFSALAYIGTELGLLDRQNTRTQSTLGSRINTGEIIVLAVRAASFLNSVRPAAKKAEAELDQIQSIKNDLEGLISEAQQTVQSFDRSLERANRSIDVAKGFYRRSALKNIGHAKELLNSWDDRFSETHQLFFDKLKFEAPVKLWEQRAEEHNRASNKARNVFWGMFLFVFLTMLILVTFFGDAFASFFVRETCDMTVCKQELSPKGPLAAGSVLLFTSLALWILRLQNKIRLSERHLALDASERKAFVETYLAMKIDQQASVEHQAIMMASIFRPTQDGIVKDDESTLDLSAAAIISRTLSRNP